MPPKTPAKAQPMPSKKDAMVDYKGFDKLSDAAFLKVPKTHGMYKERSEKTFGGTHKPILEGLNSALSMDSATAAASLSASEEEKERTSGSQASASTSWSRNLQTVMIGDSMIECLKTTGMGGSASSVSTLKVTPFALLQYLAPSVSVSAATKSRIRFIEWVSAPTIYSFPIPPPSSSSLSRLEPTIFVQSGHSPPKKPRNMVYSSVLYCGMFRRFDVPDIIVKEGNAKLDRIVDEINGGGGEGFDGWIGRVEFVSAPEVKDSDFVDDVHLNRTEYQIWSDWLWPITERILTRD